MKTHATKTELSIAMGLVAVLITILGWLVVDKIRVMEAKDLDQEAKNARQWAELAKSKECLLEQNAKLRERVAYIEGFHEGERRK